MFSKKANYIFIILTGFFLSLQTLSAQNALDEDGKKTGHWVITGDISKEKGYAADSIVEEGDYKRNRKTGIWKKYWPNGNQKSEILYKNGRSTGPYTTYHSTGNIDEKGTMQGGMLVGSFEMYYPDGTPKQKKNFSETGETEGTVTYWYENGNKELEFETVNGKESGEATWFYENGDTKKVKNFADGVVQETKELERVNPPYQDPNPPVVQKGPKASGKENSAQGGKNGSQIVDGYHKTYDGDGNILMDGEFKGGRLDNGRHYIYDEFGLLDHIEVYKAGEFAGNGIIGAKDKY